MNDYMKVDNNTVFKVFKTKEGLVGCKKSEKKYLYRAYPEAIEVREARIEELVNSRVKLIFNW